MVPEVVTKGTAQRELQELKRKIKQTSQNAAACDSELAALRAHQGVVGRELEERSRAIQQVRRVG